MADNWQPVLAQADQDAKSKKDLKEIHAKALKRADEAFISERENIREGREDQKFYAGDQWDEAARKARGLERPMLVVNRMGTFVRQVTGDLRQNTPAVKVLPSGGEASQEKAEILSGMIRSIEAKSDASAAYVRGASNAAIAGQGAFRVLTRYCNDKNFDQELYIEPIADPFGVLIDPFARAPDKSDMEYGFLFDPMSKEAFNTKYPDAVEDDFPIVMDAKTSGFQWITGDKVITAEYWCRETEKATLYELDDGTITDTLPKGAKPAKQREVDVVSIVSYIMSGREILSGPHPWAGKYIPICFIPGEEITIDGATKRKGIVRDAKDPQRLVNYARTTDAESTALQPKAPFVATVDQIKGHETLWKSAGTKNHPYLLYNFVPGLGPNQAPARSQPPVMSSGLQNLSTQAGQDLHDVTGIYPASLGAKSNETSGIAIRARQHEGDTGSNYIPDNTKRAIAYCGRILCDLIPKIYDNERIVRVLKESGEHEMAKINADPSMGEAEDPNMTVVDTLAEGEYDVVVATGPSYLTRQQEMADTMVQLAQSMPIIGQAAPDLLVKALNFPGGDEIADRITPPQFKKDDQGNPLPPPPPSPEQLAELADTMAGVQLKKAQAENQEVQAAETLTTILQTMQAMQMNMQTMQAQLAGGLPQVGPGGPPQAPPPPAGGPAPMIDPGAGPASPPPPHPMAGPSGMAELEPIHGAPV